MQCTNDVIKTELARTQTLMVGIVMPKLVAVDSTQLYHHIRSSEK